MSFNEATHKQYDAFFSIHVLSVNVSVSQKPIYVAIPYHSARAFAVREAVIKTETADGQWTVLDSTEVTFDNLNYKVRHTQRTNTPSLFNVANYTPAIDCALWNAALFSGIF